MPYQKLTILAALSALTLALSGCIIVVDEDDDDNDRDWDESRVERSESGDVA